MTDINTGLRPYYNFSNNQKQLYKHFQVLCKPEQVCAIMYRRRAIDNRGYNSKIIFLTLRLSFKNRIKNDF